jgi:hypothetical protein
MKAAWWESSRPQNGQAETNHLSYKATGLTHKLTSTVGSSGICFYLFQVLLGAFENFKSHMRLLKQF